MGTTLNQTKQSFKAIGLVNELDLTREDCEIKVRDSKTGDTSTVAGERIRGRVSVDIGGDTKQFDVFCNSLTSTGAESRQWANAEAMMELNPKIGGDPKYDPSLVVVSGRVSENRYFSTKTNDVTVSLRWNASRISTSRVSEDDEYGCGLNGVFFIRSIKPEVKDEEETGRLKVALVAVDYNASPIVIDAIVEEKDAEDFEDAYEAGQTVYFNLQVRVEQVGPKVQKRMKFGDAVEANKFTNKGFINQYLVIVGGNDVIEESDETDDDGNPIDNGYIDPKAMKIALKERDTALAEIKSNGASNTSKSNKSDLSSAKNRAKAQAKNKTKPKPQVEEDDPFDDEEEPF